MKKVDCVVELRSVDQEMRHVSINSVRAARAMGTARREAAFAMRPMC